MPPEPANERVLVAIERTVGAWAPEAESCCGLATLADDGAVDKLAVTRCDLATDAGLGFAAAAVLPEAVDEFDG